MSEIQILNWEKSNQPISEELLRRNFPRPDYRVSPVIYRNGDAHFPGSARVGLLFVLEGKCKCSFGRKNEISVVLDAGQYVNFPEGSYCIEPLENQDAKIAFVWNTAKMFEEFFPHHPTSK